MQEAIDKLKDGGINCSACGSKNTVYKSHTDSKISDEHWTIISEWFCSDCSYLTTGWHQKTPRMTNFKAEPIFYQLKR